VTPPPVAPAPPPEPRPRLTIELIKALPNTELKDRYINTLIEAEMEREAFDMDQRRARVFALSGEFADIRGQTLEQSIAKAMAKIQLGRSWGFSPGDSMRNIYFTNGRPNVENTLVASKLQQAGWGWDPKFDYDDIQHKGKPYKRCIGCTLWLKKFDPETQTYKPVLDRDGDQVHEFFTLAEAEQIKVYEKGNTQPLADKFNYQSWPREMYYWRSVGRIHKFHAPHILRGGVIREEALDVIPGDAPPEMLPPEIQAAALEPPPAAPSKTKRKQLRDEILAQESLLEKPDAKE
jgi:hypothetical protein